MSAPALTGGFITDGSQLRGNAFLPSDWRSYNALFVMDHFLGRQRVDRLFRNWRNDLMKSLLNSIRSNGPGRCIPLPRIRDLDRKTYLKDFVAKGRPVIFEGAAKDWECSRKWSFAWIKQQYGNDPAILVEHEQVEHVLLADLIDGIDGDAMKYARFHPLLQRHPELRKDIDQKWFHEHLTNPHRPTQGR